MIALLLNLLSRFAIPLVILAAMLGGLWGYGHYQFKAGERTVQAQWDKEKQEMAQAINEANMRAAQAGHRYEEWKLRQKPRIVTRTVEVERVLQNEPVWSATALPDAVQKAIEEAVRSASDVR